MNKFLAGFSGIFLWVVLGAQVSAMCIWFIPPGRTFEPARDIKTLVKVDGDQQQLVVQPQFQGSATDFGLVMPFPSEPEIAEAPTKIFKQLEDLTNPIQDFPIDEPIPLTAEGDAANLSPRDVEVVEIRDVGDFTATTLSASSSEALVEWLNQNNYQITEEKLETLEYYVEKGTQTFVALKINMSQADVNKDGLLKGELDPLTFTFNSSQVELPLRLMASPAGEIFNLIIYTLGAQQLYVPGAEIQFARKVTAKDLDDFSVLKNFDAESQWLTRSNVSLDTSKVEKDLIFYQTPADVVVEVGDQSVRVNPDLLDPKTGLIEADNGIIRYVEEADASDDQTNDDKSLENSRPLVVIVVLLGVSNILLLNTVLKQRTERMQAEKKASRGKK
ncbi:MAG: DUF2330 domain-containing protein [Candidatus Saccharimonadales bacterium]|nr:DUF2330 domain-containing protein [Candidatus Saccharimonadales bacterium]